MRIAAQLLCHLRTASRRWVRSVSKNVILKEHFGATTFDRQFSEPLPVIESELYLKTWLWKIIFGQFLLMVMFANNIQSQEVRPFFGAPIFAPISGIATAHFTAHFCARFSSPLSHTPASVFGATQKYAENARDKCARSQEGVIRRGVPPICHRDLCSHSTDVHSMRLDREIAASPD